MLAGVLVIVGLRARVFVCVCVSLCVCVFRCSESLPHDIPKLPHCEFVCLVDACILRQGSALKNTNERMLNHVLLAHKKTLLLQEDVPLLATNLRIPHVSVSLKKCPPLQGSQKPMSLWTRVSEIVLKHGPLS